MYWITFYILIFPPGGIAEVTKGGKLQVEIRSWAVKKVWITSGLTVSIEE